jgi:hypothetical protein
VIAERDRLIDLRPLAWAVARDAGLRSKKQAAGQAAKLNPNQLNLALEIGYFWAIARDDRAPWGGTDPSNRLDERPPCMELGRRAQATAARRLNSSRALASCV